MHGLVKRLSFPICDFLSRFSPYTNSRQKIDIRDRKDFLIWVKVGGDVCRCPRGFRGKGPVALAVPARTIKYMINIIVTFLGDNDKAVKSRKINDRIKDILQKQGQDRVHETDERESREQRLAEAEDSHRTASCCR